MRPNDSGGLAGEVVVEPDEAHGARRGPRRRKKTRRRECGMVRAQKAMINAFRASVFACPGYRSAMRRLASQGR